jgi:hypothetical protein
LAFRRLNSLLKSGKTVKGFGRRDRDGRKPADEVAGRSAIIRHRAQQRPAALVGIPKKIPGLNNGPRLLKSE